MTFYRNPFEKEYELISESVEMLMHLYPELLSRDKPITETNAIQPDEDHD